MLILAIILFGMLIGAGAQLILGRSRGRIDWPMAFASGLVGSFVGGLLISLLSGDGLDLRPSGIIGSLAGATIVTAAWRWWDSRNTKHTAAERAARRSGDPRRSHPR
ncbi:MAG TPA: GlsB/YeaQ/YmgE family stress response membrane protein [Nocardioides sp.]|uniref:GlsB/YeaQ/YmgE family stress response membrane protein n=1 Tax=Nocardioides sp. TaxID=35761 RepID=UPI002E36201E|nr:GlsB/YeaQ/YmgE family stress response membrane protein [Nocardioides sp.]HEX5090901.1 GlsB/YeaQ/YmgE family stress response membrane protein [Nocardioides sp.]